MSVVSLDKKRRTHAPRDLVEIDKTSGPARYYDKMRRDIVSDLAGRRNISRIQTELIDSFCGCATQLKYLNYQIMLGETGEIDLGGYATIASTMLRIGSKLGLAKRKQNEAMSFGEVIAQDQAEERARLAEDHEQQTEETAE